MSTAIGTARLGFLGVGWIGRNRMEAIAQSGAAEVAAIADASDDILAAAAESAPDAERVSSLDALLEMEPDGIVIATPSALHAEQSMQALERGIAVFCQKPLGRTASEVRRVLDAARAANRLLGVDFSYRFTAGMQRIRSLIQEGDIGSVYSADLVFHNAYGPDKDWFYDVARAGGGCVMDLGIHLVDLALWTLDFPDVESVASRLYAQGEALGPDPQQVEDYATARLDFKDGGSAQLACSWNLHAGREAQIEATFYGTDGTLSLRNVGGSFYDFSVERYRGTSSETLISPPDDWGGRAAVDWARRLAEGDGFDPSVASVVRVADVLDRIYGR